MIVLIYLPTWFRYSREQALQSLVYEHYSFVLFDWIPYIYGARAALSIAARAFEFFANGWLRPYERAREGRGSDFFSSRQHFSPKNNRFLCVSIFAAWLKLLEVSDGAPSRAPSDGGLRAPALRGGVRRELQIDR